MKLAEQFYNICWFKVDVPDTSLVRTKAKGKVKERDYYVSNFDLVASLGATEFKCYIEWKDEKGGINRGYISPIWGDVSENNLVISLDLGTTYSAASWAFLQNSQEPNILDVSEFRENLLAKVPTVLYYDGRGELRAVGSETLDKATIVDATEQGWTRVEWYATPMVDTTPKCKPDICV
ncbi:hypothetical protein FRC03_004652 [Tulasnella sp. 419]|nr:hypothetical protein FRC03_004652 [Tulasnella sp. 419]